MMLFQKKKNPVLELQKQLDKERILMGKVLEDEKFETDDKIMFSLIERIFEAGKEEAVRLKLMDKIWWGFWGFIAGAFIVQLLFFTKIINP